MIIMEMVVKLDTLKDTCIPKVFKERTWTKLLNPNGVMYLEIIKEFFSNASVEGDHINCWVRHKEFVITRESIQEFLEVCPPSQLIMVQYDDLLESIEEMVTILGGTLKKSSMNNSIQSKDKDFSLCDDPQFVFGHQPNDIVCSKDNLLVRSLHSQGD